MNISHGHEEKSRLGRLLVGRGYLTEAQLESGLKVQRETGQRLGEVFVQSGWITEKELHRVLKHQSRYRNAAAIVTMVVLPFQPLVSFASNNGSGQYSNQEAGEFYDQSGFEPLTDVEMSESVGRAADDFMQRLETLRDRTVTAQETGGDSLGDAPEDALDGLKMVAGAFVPITHFLDSDMSISGVHYREGESRFHLGSDGSLQLALPERIEQIRMDNIRVAGGAGPSMGNIIISDIRFSANSSITITPR
ncbi:pilus assembly protein PilB [Marinobacter sp. CA1]|uniref:pilus assembly protein PilB n=1 Tax=Marinobacter sp. CA1 TaxID=2817656 RepID=UPI001D06E230|nr:pilus assembly protein PilB [Marinobacter sp. CA1]UDL03454.1 pilus assembly protein PilB [Marinobacter sp. CA1]